MSLKDSERKSQVGFSDSDENSYSYSVNDDGINPPEDRFNKHSNIIQNQYAAHIKWFPIGFADFQPETGTSSIVQAAIPAGYLILGSKLTYSQEFSGSGITASNVQIGVNADPNRYLPTLDMNPVPTDTPARRRWGQHFEGNNDLTAHLIDVKITVVDGVIDELNAGQMLLGVLVVKAIQ